MDDKDRLFSNDCLGFLKILKQMNVEHNKGSFLIWNDARNYKCDMLLYTMFGYI